MYLNGVKGVWSCWTCFGIKRTPPSAPFSLLLSRSPKGTFLTELFFLVGKSPSSSHSEMKSFYLVDFLLINGKNSPFSLSRVSIFSAPNWKFPSRPLFDGKGGRRYAENFACIRNLRNSHGSNSASTRDTLFVKASSSRCNYAYFVENASMDLRTYLLRRLASIFACTLIEESGWPHFFGHNNIIY